MLKSLRELSTDHLAAKVESLAHGINDNQLSSYIMGKIQEFALRGGKEMDGSLVIGRQPNFRLVNARGEFLDDDDPTALVADPDTAVYILNDRLQVPRHSNLLELSSTRQTFFQLKAKICSNNKKILSLYR
jgi:hypothetical protein